MKNLLCLLLFAFSLPLFAQKPNVSMPATGRLYGKVIDAATNDPVAYASVTVLYTLPNGQDSLVTGALTLENGDFNFTGLPMGAYNVKASFMGNKDVVKRARLTAPGNSEQDLGNLGMTPETTLLKAAEVTAEKSSTTLSLEKRVFNVDKNITAAGGTAEDVLKNVPSVTVDMDGNAKLRDKSATIYVDGKPSLMSLNQIPADQIEAVEVISNPSAKYEAATMGGILNIVLKKNHQSGYNGVLSLGVGTQNRYNGMLNLNATQGRWSASGFYSINSSNAPTSAYVYRTSLNPQGDITGFFNQNSEVTFQNTFQTGRLNLDYQLDNRNTLSLAGTVSGGTFKIPVLQNYEYLTAGGEATSYGVRQTLSQNQFNRNSIEAQWKKSYPTKGKLLTVLANYAWDNSSNKGFWNTTGFDNAGAMLTGYPELVDIEGANSSGQMVFQVDYVLPINDSTKLETGGRSFWSARGQEYYFDEFDYAENDYVQNNQFSQNLDLTESINAAYVTFSGQWKHRISYQAGLRFEQSGLTGRSQLATTPDFGYQFPGWTGKDVLNSLFPALYLTKKLDEHTDLGLNFSRKIQRPNFRQIMPGIQGNDKQNIQMGNPNLEPEFINLAELNFNKIFGAGNWLASLYLSNETNTLKPLIRPSAADSTVLITTFVNGQNELTYGLDNTLKWQFGKNVDVMLSANVFRYNVTVDTFTNSGWAANGKASLNWRLPEHFSLQINGAYEGNRPIPQGKRQGIAYMDFAVKKSFFNNAASVTFSVNDVFNTRKDITIFSQPAYYQETMRRRDARFYKLSVQIPFGKADASLAKKSIKKQVEEQPDFGN